MTKISQLSDIGGSLAAGDEFVIRDVSDISTPNKKVTASGFIDYVIAQGVGSGFTQISAGATAPASVRCFSSGTTREVIVTTSGVERARFTTAGQLRMAGAGITFNGDTATANELDDYEEGTFVPTVIGSATAGTATYSTQTGNYTKIGRMVTVTIFLGWSAGSGSGNLQITGLPFNVNGSTNFFFPVSIGYVVNIALTANNYILGYAYQGSSRIDFVQSPTGGGAQTDVPYDAAGALMVSCSYLV